MFSPEHYKSGSGGKPKPSTEDPHRGKKHSGQEDRKSEKESSDAYVDLYCAIYAPSGGNCYHFAFVTFNPEEGRWSIFEAVRNVANGPLRPHRLEIDPRNSVRCLPLESLGRMNAGWVPTFIDAVGGITVPGEADSWNCQDYVMEIWKMMLDMGMIDERTWSTGKATMLRFYGPDFGGDERRVHKKLEDEKNDNDNIEKGPKGRYPLSEEYVFDSESSEG
ncbi:hypothetical protein F4802DRAFT_612135 [Xylaria palmicola]|nr:hypothetical protein F4802DRAFT_612135 [Xylaria palmicola]